MSLLTELDSYLKLLEAHGSLIPKVLTPLEDGATLRPLGDLDMVTVPDELAAYFQRANGYDRLACHDLDLFEPELAWGMTPLSVDACADHYDDLAYVGGDENPDYYPYGFLPILWDGSGSYLCVNCLQSSSTFGGVYDMTEGVGCNRVSASLSDFFASSASEVTTGLRKYERDRSTIAVSPADYLQRAASLFGHTPYFARIGRFDQQIVDWK